MMPRDVSARLGLLGLAGLLLLAGCSAFGIPELRIVGGVASPPAACPGEIPATPDLSGEWWADPPRRPSWLVEPLPAHAAPPKSSRERAIRIAHNNMDFEGEPTAVV